MKKIVPDPPIPTPFLGHFGSCNGAHAPLFAVRADVDIQDALAHLSAALTAAFETNAQLCEMLSRPVADVAWSTYQSLEICQALSEALLENVAKKQATE
ncbi:DUF3077 domain-containing protein [Pseudomonas sp. Irchel 3E13]|uniref:DUF3077 domain-containing protein n=1 Tax=Pseudomonas sp. Irchel 3E13 TaxID=2008975 RepID=UPI000BA44223|nr:DUF3077 domain-containing protein [Pseudomonas sp. Irchel 3E13]